MDACGRHGTTGCGGALQFAVLQRARPASRGVKELLAYTRLTVAGGASR